MAAKKRATEKISNPKAKKSKVKHREMEGILSNLEATYSKLIPREDAPTEKRIAAEMAAFEKKKSRARKGREHFESSFQPGRGEKVLAAVEPTFWLDRLSEYKERKTEALRSSLRFTSFDPSSSPPLPGPSIPGTNNWTPIGPSVISRGQAAGRPAVSGRVSGIAVAPGGSVVYVATANGGVWRSDNGGASWRSTMEAFDLNPTSFASTSLACGAIAIDENNPNRVYVGTGEGDSNALFATRLIDTLPSYRGIGPIRTDDGGATWVTEPTAPTSQTLAGAAFFALAVDPADPESVVAATTTGLYQRTVVGPTFQWVQRRTGIHASVVVAHAGGTTTFYAAAWGGPVYRSTNGTTWSKVGTAFPTDVGRVALGVQRHNPNVLYALVATTEGDLHGVYRLDGAAGPWKKVAGAPASLLGGSQGDYDLAVAVDPGNVSRIYLGGDAVLSSEEWTGAIYRCQVKPSGEAYSMAAKKIGAHTHSDVHVLVHEPGNADALWAGCDGGLFFNSNPAGDGSFEPRNTGLATLCTNYFGQHPTEAAVIFCGLQDNGTARSVGEECWRHVLYADGGYCVVNWADPFKVLVYANGTAYLATDGGQDYGSWSAFEAPWQIMAEPLVGTPFNPARPGDADTVAFGVGSTVYISDNFGSTWPTTVTVSSGGAIYSMVFASPTRLFLGTTNGHVYRLDKSVGSWGPPVRLDNVAAGPLELVGMISDIGVDWSDAALNSIYVTFAGSGDYRHVWHFDGTRWQARSGPAGDNKPRLLDVEHNAIVVDADAPANVYVGADIGVWHSIDGGSTWTPLPNGLPDAPVFDLQIHRGARLLRASLHGRGLFEYKLDPPVPPDVELYVRDTALDTGRGAVKDGLSDPSVWPTRTVWHWNSANIKVDAPTPLGYQTPTDKIDFFQFNEVIADGSQGVGTIGPPNIVDNRVYVEAHNRGRVDASAVQVMVAVTNASLGLGLLPAGYEMNVQSGTPFAGDNWITLGVKTLSDLRAGFPQVAAFDLPSTLLPLPASLPGQSHFCLVAFLHSPVQDPYTNTERNVDLLTLQDRKVAQKSLHIVEFVGTSQPPRNGMAIWAMIDLNGVVMKRRGLIDIILDAQGYPGQLHLAVPQKLIPADLREQSKHFAARSNKSLRAWVDNHMKVAERLYWEGRYRKEHHDKLIDAMRLVREQPLLKARGSDGISILRNIELGPKDTHTLFIKIEPPEKVRKGDLYEFHLMPRDAKTGTLLGGGTYRVVFNRQARKG